MKTKISKITKKNSKKILKEASNIIKEGGLVVFPTETVYGLGADIFNKKALLKIFSAKGRPSDNPIITHIGRKEQLKELLTNSISSLEQKLIDNFWPGPLTIIFKKKDIVSSIVSGGLNTIAVRMPSNIFAREFINLSNTPIAAPSANTSGRPSGTRIKDIYNDLFNKVDMIIDAGESKIGVESTVVKINKNQVLILRPGAVTKKMLEKILFPMPVIFAKDKNELLVSPGTKYKHYAPKAKLEIFPKEEIKSKAKTLKDKGLKVGILATKQNKNVLDKYLSDIFTIGDENNLEEISQNLYKALRFFDTHKVDIILCQSFPLEGLGVAIMDRLNRASTKGS